MGTGRYDEAVEHCKAGQATAARGDDPAIGIRAVDRLRLVALAQGRPGDALGHVAEDLRLSTELYRQHDVGLALINLGAALTKTGDAAEGISAALTGEARRLYEEALPVLVDLGRPNPPKSTPACRPSDPGTKSLDLLKCASFGRRTRGRGAGALQPNVSEQRTSRTVHAIAKARI